MTLDAANDLNVVVNDGKPTVGAVVTIEAGLGPRHVQESWAILEHELRASPALESSSAVFAHWIKWLHLVPTAGDAGHIFYEDGYWQLIQQGLRVPSAEQRKYCLYILRKSLNLLDVDVNVTRLAFVAGEEHRRGVLQAYERYITLFSTLVLDRYIGQVLDCLSDLQELATPYSAIDPSWIVVLLEATLQHGVQDSVRRVVGKSFISWDLTTYLQTDVWADFFTLSFLPWACQGTLFTSSIIKSPPDDVHLCQHGEALASFISRLFALCEDEAEALRLFRQILTFIKDKGQKLVSFAAGSYLLDGTLSGVRSVVNNGMRLAPDQADTILTIEVSNQTGLPEVARDLHTACCAEILGLISNKSLNEAYENDVRLNDLRDRFQRLKLRYSGQNETRTIMQKTFNSDIAFLRGVDNIDDNPSCDALVRYIDESKHACLSGSGVVEALLYVRHCLDMNAFSTQDVILRALSAAWSEIELQDYPKQALMLVSATFFHKNLIIQLSNKSDLADFIFTKLYEMQRFAEGRVYVLATFTKAIRKLYLAAPTDAVKLPLQSYICRFADAPPAPKPEFLLESSLANTLQEQYPACTYESYYGDREGIGHAAFFDLLNRLQPTDHNLGLQIVDQLLGPWLSQTQPVPMVSKTKTTQHLQVIILLIDKCVSDVHVLRVAEVYFEKFLALLALEPLPRYRYLLEWIIVILIRKSSDLRRHLLEPLRKPEHENPKFLASLIKVAVHAARLPHAPEEFGLRLATAMVATSASPKVAVRHESQWSFLILWDHAEREKWRSVTENVAFAALNDYIRCLDRYANPPPQRLLENFDYQTDHNLTNLFEGDYLMIEPPEKSLLRADDFIVLWSMEKEVAEVNLNMKLRPESLSKESSMVARKEEMVIQDSSQDKTQTRNPLQTKSATWQNNLALDLSSLSETARRAVRSITVFASHISFAHNLGGISRAAEIFGAESLVIGKTSTLNDIAFKGVSVNSHLHLPIEEIPAQEDAIRAFLAEKRRSGYGVVGVEQTDSSIVLGQTLQRNGLGDTDDVAKVFPKKSVLIMGSEKEGIPGWLLAECDVCVEIPQVGVTRSLNVQTAAAIALYEYGREWPTT